jgi:hypothetical protein
MHETAILHFDLGHLSPHQTFTLHAGSRRYELTRHSGHSLARARRANAALALLPDRRVTHFAGPVRLPGNSPLLLRVTAPKLRPDDLLDRLVLTSIHLPRRHRAAGVARRQRRRGRLPMATPPCCDSIRSPKLASLTLADGNLPPDKVLIDIGDWNTALDAATSLVFHHSELLTTQAAPAADIICLIQSARGINDLADSIWGQDQAHEKDPSQPSWVYSLPGTDWQTGKPANPVYVWSDQTLEYLALPLQDTLQRTKNDPDLQHQCWTVQRGITQLPMTIAAVGGRRLRDAEATYTVREVTPQSGVEHSFDYDPTTSTATVSLKNYYLRWLQVCVDQYEPGPDGPKVGQTQTLGQQAPVDTIMAVPLDPDWSDFSFTFDPRASRAVVSFGGLGQAPFDLTYDSGGIIWTSVFNYAVPTLFIALGVAADQGGKAWADLTKSIVAKGSALVEAAAEGPLGDAVSGGVSLTDVLAAIANLAGSLLLGAITSSETFTDYIAAAIGESAIEDAEPFVGWIALAIGAAADLASMIETSVEVARSPATMAISIERTLDIEVTVNPDPNDVVVGPGGKTVAVWPAAATHYVISITYDDGPVRFYDGQMSPTTQEGPIVHTFSGLPAGGNITVLACFYSATGWLAGQGTAGPLPAQPNQGSTLVVPAFNIKENLVPLSNSTTYTLKQKLAFGSQGRTWLAPPDVSWPTATVSDLDSSNVGNNLEQLGQLTVNEERALGYLWQASGQNVPLKGTGNQPYPGQEWTFQALIEAAEPQSSMKFSGYGYTAQPCLAFSSPTMANPLADGFLLEPDMSGAAAQPPPYPTMLLRAVSLQPGQPMIASAGQSFGRFTFPQDDLAIHPAGYAVALNTVTCKLQVVRLIALYADADAPTAAILAGTGTRPGLLCNPVAVACALDRILVLQAGTPDYYPQGSVCAFDVKGNPVNCFGGGAWLTGLHPEGSANVVVVDLSIESKGYLYVLKYLEPVSGSGQVLFSNYRLDIYNPDGSFLTQVSDLAAARLQVDLWRNLFTLNYEILQGSGRTEPSVAEWIPSTPSASTGQTGGN